MYDDGRSSRLPPVLLRSYGLHGTAQYIYCLFATVIVPVDYTVS